MNHRRPSELIKIFIRTACTDQNAGSRADRNEMGSAHSRPDMRCVAQMMACHRRIFGARVIVSVDGAAPSRETRA